MTKQLTALKALEQTVAAMNEPHKFSELWGQAFGKDAFLNLFSQAAPYFAYKGSVGTAIALAEAAVPDWEWRISSNLGASLWHKKYGHIDVQDVTRPSRALLLAVIRAKIVEVTE